MNRQSFYYVGLWWAVLCLSQMAELVVGASSTNREVRAYEEASQIYNTMFDEYDKRIRPQPNHSEPVLVRMEVTIDHIYSFDVSSQILHSLLSLSLRWSDRRLAWYPQKLQSIYTKKVRVWTPNIFLLNGLSQPQDLEDHSIYLEYQGNLVWHRKISVKTLCPTEIGNDTHTCGYFFASTPFKSSEEQLQITRFNIADNFNNHFWNVSRQTEFHSVRSPSTSDSSLTNVATAVGRIRLIKDEEGHRYYHSKAISLSTNIYLMAVACLTFVLTKQN